MNIAYFFARRMAFNSGGSFSRFIIRLAMVAVACSVAVMVVTTAVVNGFQQEISRKTFAFWGHIHISNLDLNNSYEDIHPISTDQTFYPSLGKQAGFKHIQVYARKAGIAKTNDEIEGLMLKGIGKDYNWAEISPFMVAGKPITMPDTTASNDILISQTTAHRLKLKVGDKLTIYFVDKPPRVRRFDIAGIYNTGLAEYDEQYALIDIRQIQRLNAWQDDQVGGFEVFINDVNQLDTLTDQIYYTIPNQLNAESMKEVNPNLFQWLDLQNMNKHVLLTLMTVMAIINMITTLLILILDRTNMIGILKALGASNWTIQKIFLYNAAYIISLGVLIGNVIGLGICWLQKTFHLIQLPPESYYLSVAPVAIDWLLILLINIATLFICVLALIIPSILVTRVNVIKAIRFK